MELLISLFPSTPLGWIVQIVGSVVASYIAISFIEYMFHRFIMHEGLPEWIYKIFPELREVLDEHRRLHHQVYYKVFDYEPDPVGYELNLRIYWYQSVAGAVCFIPYFIITTYYISLVPTLVLCVLALLHNMTWNTIHVEMHHAQHPWWTKLWAYKFLARNHFLHHQDTHTGFNIVCPLFDYLFGTIHPKIVTVEESKEIERLGFLK
jgi:hypothetical protein